MFPYIKLAKDAAVHGSAGSRHVGLECWTETGAAEGIRNNPAKEDREIITTVDKVSDREKTNEKYRGVILKDSLMHTREEERQ